MNWNALVGLMPFLVIKGTSHVYLLFFFVIITLFLINSHQNKITNESKKFVTQTHTKINNKKNK